MKTNLRRKDKMKKKGFTLIELLAVIVILAIIALIAVPVVMNIISKANKSAFKDSAYGILKAGQNYYMEELLNAEGMTEDKMFDFSNDTSDLEINGSKPTSGQMIVNKEGRVSMAITNGKHCVTKGFNDEDVTITDDVANCMLLGQIVYYNPNEDEVCDETKYNANANKNGNSGCMRWYVYGFDGNKQKLILDHNTTNGVPWISAEHYIDNDGCASTSCNDQGAKTLFEQLQKDTEEWNKELKVDIITLEDVLKLLPYYQKLTLDEQQMWLKKEGEAEVLEYYSAITNAMNDGKYPIGKDKVELWRAQNEYLTANYSDLVLPKYMYEDVIGKCKNVGDDTNGYYVQCDSYGYWVQTAYAPHHRRAWAIKYNSIMDRQVVSTANYGVRPVITLSN